MIVTLTLIDTDIDSLFALNLMLIFLLGLEVGAVRAYYTTTYMPEIHQVTLVDQTRAFHQRSLFESIGFVLGSGVQFMLVQLYLEHKWFKV